MGASLHSIGEWIGVITFLAVIIAGANTRIQSPAIWLCLGLWFAIVVLYLLVKLIRARVNVRSSQTGTYRKDREPLLRLGDKKQYLTNTIVEGSISQQLQILKSKEAGFKLPSLAGFYPRQLPGSTNKKPRRQASPSQGSAPGKEGDFELPPLAGFAPGQPKSQRIKTHVGKPLHHKVQLQVRKEISNFHHWQVSLQGNPKSQRIKTQVKNPPHRKVTYRLDYHLSFFFNSC